MGACEAVRTVSKQKDIMPPETFTKVFLQHILNSLESRDTGKIYIIRLVYYAKSINVLACQSIKLMTIFS